MRTDRNQNESWARAAIGIVRSPETSFQLIHQHRPWVGIFLIASLATVLQGLVTAPYAIEELTRTLSDAGFPSTEVVPTIFYSGLVISPVLALLGWLLEAVLIWLLAMAFGSGAGFVRAFSLTVHLNIINFLSGLASLLVLLVSRAVGMRPDLRDVEDMLSLSPLLPTDSVALEVVCSRVGPFSVWFVVLLALGSVSVFQMPRRRGWMMAGVHWTAVTLLSVAATSVSGMLSS